MGTGKMPPYVEESKVTRRTCVILLSLYRKRLGLTECGIESTTQSTNGSSTLVICVSLSSVRVRLSVLGIRLTTLSTDGRLGESIR